MEFDGVNDSMSMLATAAGIARNKTQGWIFAAVLDRNPTGGAIVHVCVWFTVGTSDSARFAIYTRAFGDNGAVSYGRRTDADSDSIAKTTPYGSGVKIVETEANWGSNYQAVWMNGARSATAAYSSGAGSTSNTDSLFARIGEGAGLANPSTLAAATVFNTAIDLALAARVRHCSARAFLIAST